jgi:hypothetical protein
LHEARKQVRQLGHQFAAAGPVGRIVLHSTKHRAIDGRYRRLTRCQGLVQLFTLIVIDHKQQEIFEQFNLGRLGPCLLLKPLAACLQKGAAARQNGEQVGVRRLTADTHIPVGVGFIERVPQSLPFPLNPLGQERIAIRQSRNRFGKREISFCEQRHGK